MIPARVESGDIMNRSSDFLIGQYLKNWLGQHRPPANARARLLWDAAHQAPGTSQKLPLFPHPQFNHHQVSSSDEWSQTLFLWISEHSFQSGLQTRLI
jgi:hypothetical protein